MGQSNVWKTAAATLGVDPTALQEALAILAAQKGPAVLDEPDSAKPKPKATKVAQPKAQKGPKPRPWHRAEPGGTVTPSTLDCSGDDIPAINLLRNKYRELIEDAPTEDATLIQVDSQGNRTEGLISFTGYVRRFLVLQGYDTPSGSKGSLTTDPRRIQRLPCWARLKVSSGLKPMDDQGRLMPQSWVNHMFSRGYGYCLGAKDWGTDHNGRPGGSKRSTGAFRAVEVGEDIPDDIG